MGYVIYSIVEDTLVIHYVYVKSVVRNKYIATNLLKEVIKDRKMIIFTHMFDSFSKVKYKLKDVKMVYDQYLLTSLRLHEGKSGNI